MRSSFRKFIAIVIAFSYFSTQVVLGALAESNLLDRQAGLWAERKKAAVSQSPAARTMLPTLSRLGSFCSEKKSVSLSNPLRELVDSISLANATVQEIYDPKNAAVAPVLLLQDIHLNPEAQTNIAAVIDGLMKRGRVGLVGLEGAFNKFEFAGIRSHLEKAERDALAKSLLSEKKMAGAPYAAITSAVEPPLYIGIDDVTHYEANVRAYLDGSDRKTAADEKIRALQERVDIRKKEIFTGDLRKFDDMKTAYRRGAMGFGAYVEGVAALSDAPDMMAQQFVEAYRMESRIDFTQVDRQRRLVIEKLTGRLSENEIQSLLADSAEYRAGRLGFGDYYGRLRDLCRKKDVSLDATPAFDDYVRYVLLSDGIKAAELFAGIRRMEKDLVARLAANEEQRELVRIADHAALARKLINFSLTSPEWREYSSPWNVSVQGPLSTGKVDPGLRHAGMTAITAAIPNLSMFEKFYEEADIRSEKIVENFLKAPREGGKPAVLVVGGFHAAEIGELLKARGVPHAVASPKITSVSAADGSAYLSVFAREKTPIEKLFSGRKLFVNPGAVLIGAGIDYAPGPGTPLANEQMLKSNTVEARFLPEDANPSGHAPYVSVALPFVLFGFNQGGFLSDGLAVALLVAAFIWITTRYVFQPGDASYDYVQAMTGIKKRGTVAASAEFLTKQLPLSESQRPRVALALLGALAIADATTASQIKKWFDSEDGIEQIAKRLQDRTKGVELMDRLNAVYDDAPAENRVPIHSILISAYDHAPRNVDHIWDWLISHSKQELAKTVLRGILDREDFTGWADTIAAALNTIALEHFIRKPRAIFDFARYAMTAGKTDLWWRALAAISGSTEDGKLLTRFLRWSLFKMNMRNVPGEERLSWFNFFLKNAADFLVVKDSLDGPLALRYEQVKEFSESFWVSLFLYLEKKDQAETYLSMGPYAVGFLFATIIPKVTYAVSNDINSFDVLLAAPALKNIFETKGEHAFGEDVKLDQLSFSDMFHKLTVSKHWDVVEFVDIMTVLLEMYLFTVDLENVANDRSIEAFRDFSPILKAFRSDDVDMDAQARLLAVLSRYVYASRSRSDAHYQTARDNLRGLLENASSRVLISAYGKYAYPPPPMRTVLAEKVQGVYDEYTVASSVALFSEQGEPVIDDLLNPDLKFEDAQAVEWLYLLERFMRFNFYPERVSTVVDVLTDPRFENTGSDEAREIAQRIFDMFMSKVSAGDGTPPGGLFSARTVWFESFDQNLTLMRRPTSHPLVPMTFPNLDKAVKARWIDFVTIGAIRRLLYMVKRDGRERFVEMFEWHDALTLFSLLGNVYRRPVINEQIQNYLSFVLALLKNKELVIVNGNLSSLVGGFDRVIGGLRVDGVSTDDEIKSVEKIRDEFDALRGGAAHASIALPFVLFGLSQGGVFSDGLAVALLVALVIWAATRYMFAPGETMNVARDTRTRLIAPESAATEAVRLLKSLAGLDDVSRAKYVSRILDGAREGFQASRDGRADEIAKAIAGFLDDSTETQQIAWDWLIKNIKSDFSKKVLSDLLSENRLKPLAHPDLAIVNDERQSLAVRARAFIRFLRAAPALGGVNQALKYLASVKTRDHFPVTYPLILTPAFVRHLRDLNDHGRISLFKSLKRQWFEMEIFLSEVKWLPYISGFYFEKIFNSAFLTLPSEDRKNFFSDFNAAKKVQLVCALAEDIYVSTDGWAEAGGMARLKIQTNVLTELLQDETVRENFYRDNSFAHGLSFTPFDGDYGLSHDTYIECLINYLDLINLGLNDHDRGDYRGRLIETIDRLLSSKSVGDDKKARLIAVSAQFIKGDFGKDPFEDEKEGVGPGDLFRENFSAVLIRSALPLSVYLDAYSAYRYPVLELIIRARMEAENRRFDIYHGIARLKKRVTVSDFFDENIQFDDFETVAFLRNLETAIRLGFYPRTLMKILNVALDPRFHVSDDEDASGRVAARTLEYIFKKADGDGKDVNANNSLDREIRALRDFIVPDGADGDYIPADLRSLKKSDQRKRLEFAYIQVIRQMTYFLKRRPTKFAKEFSVDDVLDLMLQVGQVKARPLSNKVVFEFFETFFETYSDEKNLPKLLADKKRIVARINRSLGGLKKEKPLPSAEIKKWEELRERIDSLSASPKPQANGAVGLWSPDGDEDLFWIGVYEGIILQFALLAWLTLVMWQGPPVYALLFFPFEIASLYFLHYKYGVAQSGDVPVYGDWKLSALATLKAQSSFLFIIGPWVHGLLNRHPPLETLQPPATPRSAPRPMGDEPSRAENPGMRFSLSLLAMPAGGAADFSFWSLLGISILLLSWRLGMNDADSASDGYIHAMKGIKEKNSAVVSKSTKDLIDLMPTLKEPQLQRATVALIKALATADETSSGLIRSWLWGGDKPEDPDKNLIPLSNLLSDERKSDFSKDLLMKIFMYSSSASIENEPLSLMELSPFLRWSEIPALSHRNFPDLGVVDALAFYKFLEAERGGFPSREMLMLEFTRSFYGSIFDPFHAELPTDADSDLQIYNALRRMNLLLDLAKNGYVASKAPINSLTVLMDFIGVEGLPRTQQEAFPVFSKVLDSHDPKANVFRKPSKRELMEAHNESSWKIERLKSNASVAPEELARWETIHRRIQKLFIAAPLAAGLACMLGDTQWGIVAGMGFVAMFMPDGKMGLYMTAMKELKETSTMSKAAGELMLMAPQLEERYRRRITAALFDALETADLQTSARIVQWLTTPEIGVYLREIFLDGKKIDDRMALLDRGYSAGVQEKQGLLRDFLVSVLEEKDGRGNGAWDWFISNHASPFSSSVIRKAMSNYDVPSVFDREGLADLAPLWSLQSMSGLDQFHVYSAMQGHMLPKGVFLKKSAEFSAMPEEQREALFSYFQKLAGVTDVMRNVVGANLTVMGAHLTRLRLARLLFPSLSEKTRSNYWAGLSADSQCSFFSDLFNEAIDENTGDQNVVARKQLVSSALLDFFRLENFNPPGLYETVSSYAVLPRGFSEELPLPLLLAIYAKVELRDLEAIIISEVVDAYNNYEIGWSLSAALGSEVTAADLWNPDLKLEDPRAIEWALNMEMSIAAGFYPVSFESLIDMALIPGFRDIDEHTLAWQIAERALALTMKRLAATVERSKHELIRIIDDPASTVLVRQVRADFALLEKGFPYEDDATYANALRRLRYLVETDTTGYLASTVRFNGFFDVLEGLSEERVLHHKFPEAWPAFLDFFAAYIDKLKMAGEQFISIDPDIIRLKLALIDRIIMGNDDPRLPPLREKFAELLDPAPPAAGAVLLALPLLGNMPGDTAGSPTFWVFSIAALAVVVGWWAYSKLRSRTPKKDESQVISARISNLIQGGDGETLSVESVDGLPRNPAPLSPNTEEDVIGFLPAIQLRDSRKLHRTFSSQV